MKKIFLLLAAVIALSSCSNEDDKNKNQEFFNLKVGNVWVYKVYNVDERGESFAYNDTVRVEGKESILGKDYYKLSHTKGLYGNGELQRVDDSGHLIYETGETVHPGTDKIFKEVRTIKNLPEYGSVAYSSEHIKDITVENKNYTVHPYVGYILPDSQIGVPEGEGITELYMPGLGLVMRRCRHLSSRTAFIEYRLVSYDLK